MSGTIRCNHGRVNSGMRRLRSAKWGLVATGAALVLAACGGSSSDGDRLGGRTGAESGGSSPSSSSSGSSADGQGTAVVTFATETDGVAPPAGGLERTAELMRERAGAAGLEGVEIEVRDGAITASGSAADEKALKSLGRTAELGFRPVTGAQVVDKSACRVQNAAASEPLTTCGTGPDDATTQYVLERVALPGSEIARAEAALDENVGSWTVNLEFTAKGAQQFTDVTGRLATQTTPANQFAIVLDGEVLSAPMVTQAITGGQAQISGTFTERTARELAAQLSTGALPVRLTESSVTRVPGG